MATHVGSNIAEGTETVPVNKGEHNQYMPNYLVTLEGVAITMGTEKITVNKNSMKRMCHIL